MKTITIYILVLSLTLVTPVSTFAEVEDDGTSLYVSDEVEGPEEDTGWTESLVLAAAIIPAPTIAMNCLSKMSSMAYLGTSLYLVGGEIFDWGDYTKGSEEAMKIAKESKGDKQIDTIKAAAKETEEAAKNAEAKKSRTQYAAIGYGVSALLALYESTTPDGGKCTKEEKPDAAGPNSGSETWRNPDTGELFNPNPADTQKTDTKLFEFGKDVKLPGQAPVQQETLPATINFDGRQSFINPNNSVIYALVNYFFPSAIAFSAAQTGLVGGAAAALATLYGPIQIYMKKSLESATTRAVVFGALAGMSYYVSTKHEKIAEALKKRAEQYNELVSAMESNTTGSGLSGRGGGSMAATDASNTIAAHDDSDKDPIEAKATGCITGSTGEANTDENCNCALTDTCKVSELSTIKTGNLGDGSVATDAMSKLSGFANNKYKGNTYDKSTFDKSEFGKLAKGISKEISALEGKINKNKADAGKLNFNEGKNLAAAKFKDIIKDGLKKLSPTDLNTLKDAVPPIRPSSLSLTDTSTTSESQGSGDKKAEKEAPEKQSGAVDIPGFEFDYKKQGLSNNGASEGGEENSEYMKQNYKFDTQSDINAKDDTPIFKIITTRYLKSAYPILLEKDAK